MRTSRLLLLVVALTALAGCSFKGVPDPQVSARDAEWMAQVPKAQEDMRYGRYLMDDPTGEAPGTVVVDTKERFLYYVLPDRKVIRIARKAEWPDWNPPAEMKVRWPHVSYTKGGPMNPLGARALYLFEGNRDTLYRIHGTNEPEKIGLAVSSGCIRMRNIDVIDLYNRVDVNAKVVVR